MELVAGRTIQLQYSLRTRIVQPLGPATANSRERRASELRRTPYTRSSQNSDKAKFAEFAKGEVRRIRNKRRWTSCATGYEKGRAPAVVGRAARPAGSEPYGTPAPMRPTGRVQTRVATGPPAIVMIAPPPTSRNKRNIKATALPKKFSRSRGV